MKFCKVLLSAVKNTNNFQVKIGLEIHARISSKTKIFSDANNALLIESQSNTNVSFFDLALPGTMPSLNKRCVEAALLTACALNCKINLISHFERKHYFYPDLPSGYQITQQSRPIAFDGFLTYPIKMSKIENRISKISRIQMEHDSGKSLSLEDLDKNSQDNSNEVLIDLNRCGIGLMEIVTEPDFSNSLETTSFVKELAAILKSIQTCDVNMQDGGFRVDVNVSVHRVNKETNELMFSPRVEIKNLNSYGAIEKAIEFEVNRQRALQIENKEVKQETRSYDAITNTTAATREKEDYHDYRFMPEPNLLPVVVYSKNLDSIGKTLFVEDLNEYKSFLNSFKTMIDSKKFNEVIFDEVEKEFEKIDLPSKRREIFVKSYKFSQADAFLLVELNLDKILIEMIRINGDENRLDANKIKNYKSILLIDYLEALNKKEDSVKLLTVEKLADVVALLNDNVINTNLRKIIFDTILYDKAYENKSPREIAQEKNLFVIYDVERIKKSVHAYLEIHSDTYAKYHSKKKKQQVLDFVFGEIQKEFDYRADSVCLAKLIKETLETKKPQK